MLFACLLVLLGVLQSLAMNVGTAMYDMTGPSVEINFMGYAVPSQRGSGIHQRLRARAYAFEQDGKHAVFVSVDGGMGSDLVKMRVLDRLNEALGDGIYTHVSESAESYSSVFLCLFFFFSICNMQLVAFARV